MPARQATWAGGIDYLESISGLHVSLKIPPLKSGWPCGNSLCSVIVAMIHSAVDVVITSNKHTVFVLLLH